VASTGAAGAGNRSGGRPRVDGLWEEVFSQENLMQALKRVEQNKGAPGVDGMTTAELRLWLRGSWPAIRLTLDEGTYRPRPDQAENLGGARPGRRTWGKHRQGGFFDPFGHLWVVGDRSPLSRLRR
jgi:hypothetical protein